MVSGTAAVFWYGKSSCAGWQENQTFIADGIVEHEQVLLKDINRDDGIVLELLVHIFTGGHGKIMDLQIIQQAF